MQVSVSTKGGYLSRPVRRMPFSYGLTNLNALKKKIEVEKRKRYNGERYRIP